MSEPHAPPAGALREIAFVFLRLGVLGFGGPAAHVALMRHEVVARRGWTSQEEFLELLGAANLVPGPTSTELALHLGQRRGGAAGLLVAGACFIVPPSIVVGLLAWGYVRFGSLPPVAAVLYGLKPVVIAVVAHALWTMGHAAVRDGWSAAVGGLAAAATLLGAQELAVLAAAALLGTLRPGPGRGGGTLALAGIPAAAAASGAATVGGIFGVFLKIGALLFGSGYVLLAFLRGELVERRGWLTEQQLLDAVAVGQMTPGPLFTTATFIGFLLAGVAGAVAATVGIFLPAFGFVGMSGWLLKAVRRFTRAAEMLRAVTLASLGLMGAVTLQLAHAAVVDAPTLGIALVSALLMFSGRVSPLWLIPMGALAGLLVAG